MGLNLRLNCAVGHQFCVKKVCWIVGKEADVCKEADVWIGRG